VPLRSDFNNPYSGLATKPDLAFRKADGTPYNPTEKEKKAMLLFRGSDNMKDLFQDIGDVTTEDSFDQAVVKIKQDHVPTVWYNVTCPLPTFHKVGNPLNDGLKKFQM